MCRVVNADPLNDELRKRFSWGKSINYLMLYLYYMDVRQDNKLCHFISKIQKGINRRLRK